MKNRDVGEMGESFFKAWTAHVGINANKAGRDKTGWDFFIELPLRQDTPRTIKLPLDRDIHPMSCLVQVKSTDERRRRRSISLQNWVRLVKNLVPAFFLVLEFDFQSNPQHAFLVHVDESYIRRVLKRLRELSPNPEPTLHKKTMQLTYENEDALGRLDGEGLEEALRKHTGTDPLVYAERKRHILQHVGYEDVKADCAFDIPWDVSQGKNIHEYLVDFGLGLIPSLQIKNLTHTDMRFGIPEPEPSLCLEGSGELRIIREPVGESIIRLRTCDGQNEYRLPAKIYPPRGFGHLVDQTYLKIRYAAPFVDFVCWVYQPRLDVRFQLPPVDQTHKLSQLMPVAGLILFFDRIHSSRHEVTLLLI